MASEHARLAILLCIVVLSGCTASPYVRPPESARDPAPGASTSTAAPETARANPASTALIQESRGLRAAEQYDAAAASLERALRIDPRNPVLWVELGQLQLSLGESRQAENMARKAISLSETTDSVRVPAWTLLAEALRAQGRDSEAREAEINVR